MNCECNTNYTQNVNEKKCTCDKQNYIEINDINVNTKRCVIGCGNFTVEKNKEATPKCTCVNGATQDGEYSCKLKQIIHQMNNQINVFVREKDQ